MTDENTKQVTLSDLRQLGKYGGSTARLDDGTELVLKAKYASQKVRGYVQGELCEVELRLRFQDIIKHIRTIKTGHHLVARKEKTPRGYQLRLTGVGYQRPVKKSKRRHL